LRQVSVTGFQLILRLRVGRRRERDELRDQPADQGQAHAGDRHVVGPDLGHGHHQPAHDLAQQDGHKSAHLDHAVAARQLTLVERLRQVGELDRAEDGGMQPHQEGAAQQHRHLHIGVVAHEADRRDQHDHHFEVLDETDHARFFKLVGELAAGGREQQKRQDEQRADGQPGQRGRQPAHAELVGHHHGEGKLEEVVVGRAGELRPEKRREAALLEQRELVRVPVNRRWRHRCGPINTHA
jgi:hypothetical protein